MSRAVIDASAILALLGREPGHEKVAELLGEGIVSAVNLSEVASKLVDLGLTPDEGRRLVESLGLDIRPFDEDQAYEAGSLRAETRKAGLSLGDRACLALARRLKLPAVTADSAWKRVPSGVEIVLVR